MFVDINTGRSMMQLVSLQGSGKAETREHKYMTAASHRM